MPETVLHGIRTVGKRGRDRPPPNGTKIWIVNPGLLGMVDVRLQLPGRVSWADLGRIPIRDGFLELPLPLCFLCHAEEDQKAVASVGDRLENDGTITWFSPRHLQAGADWKAEIDDAIHSADFVIVFLSQQSVNKAGYFQKEVKRAFELHELLPDGERFILPVLLEPCSPPRRFEDIHWIKLYEKDGYERLTNSIHDLTVPGSS